MADVIDIIHNLKYTVDDSELKTAEQALQENVDAVMQLLAALGKLDAKFKSTSAGDADALKELSAALAETKKQLEAKIAALEKTVLGNAKLKGAVENAGRSLVVTAAAVEKAKGTLESMGGVVESLPKGFDEIVTSSGGALKSFLALREEAGGTAGAFAALAQGLKGGGGIGIAITVITTLLITFKDEIIEAFTGGETAMHKFAGNLEETSKVANEELVKIQSLISTIKDENSTRKDQADALEELKRIGGGYADTLTIEKVKHGEINELLSSQIAFLKQKAVALAFEKEYKDALEKTAEAEKNLAQDNHAWWEFYLSNDKIKLQNIDKLKKAHEVEQKALTNALNPQNAALDILDEQIKAQEEKNKKIDFEIHLNTALNDDKKNLGRQVLEELKKQRAELEEQYKVHKEIHRIKLEDYDLDILNAKSRVDDTEGNKTQNRKAQIELENANYKKRVAELNKKYGDTGESYYIMNPSYQAELKNANSDHRREIRDINASFSPTNEELLKIAENRNVLLQQLKSAKKNLNDTYAKIYQDDDASANKMTKEERKDVDAEYNNQANRLDSQIGLVISAIEINLEKDNSKLKDLKLKRSKMLLDYAKLEEPIQRINPNKDGTNPETGLYDTKIKSNGNVDLSHFLDAQIEKEKQAAEKRKALQQSIKDGYKSLAETVVQTYNTILEAQQKQLDGEITAQQKRVDDLTAIQDRGNTEQLRQEQERLNELEKKRADSVKRQVELNALLGISNSALALTDAIKGVLSAAANSTELGAASYIAAIVAGFAAVAGLYASVKSLGEAEKGYAEGGYTGPGGKWQPAGTVHKGEIVWSQKDIAAYGGVSIVERMRTMQAMPLLRDTAAMQGNTDYASKKELHTLNHKMDQLIAATEGNSVRVNQKIDRHGVHQLVETARQMERVRWR